MTAEEFERQYAERSGMSVERLRELGRIVAPCDCGSEICEGWQSVNGDDHLSPFEQLLAEFERLGHLYADLERLGETMPITPGSPEWKARRAQILTDELCLPLRWWYLSFATTEAFLGGAIVEAHGPMHAIETAHRLEINPGGQVAVFEIPEEGCPPPESLINRLSTEAELEAQLGPGVELGKPNQG